MRSGGRYGRVRVNDGSRLLITPLESLPMLPPLP